MAPTPHGNPSGSQRLHLIQAVQEGWRAFCRAPWPFVLFTLVAGSLNLVFQVLCQLQEVLPKGVEAPPALLVVAVIGGTVGLVLVNLWASIGLIRGAWTALEGGRPDWATFSRWDGQAAGRLLLRHLLLAALLLGVVVAGLGLSLALTSLQPLLGAVPPIAALVVLVYLSVNQTFLPWVALLEGPGPVATLQRSRAVVDPQWGRVLLLSLVQGAILLIGLLLCGLGLLAAAPVALCVTTAAYRQLFGPEDRTGLLG